MKWTSNCEYIEDQKAIIFNLEKDKKELFKLSSSKDVAIGCFSNFGPIFAKKDNDNQDMMKTLFIKTNGQYLMNACVRMGMILK